MIFYPQSSRRRAKETNMQRNIHPHSVACQARCEYSPKKLCDLREIFSGQARLLAGRAERNLPIDLTSLERLFALGELLELERLAA
jgi:hypothetical protein